MDQASSSATLPVAQAPLGGFHAEQLPMFIFPCLAIVVWIVEHWREMRPGVDVDMGQRVFRKLLPEMAGLTAVCGLTVGLLVCYREDSSLQGDQAWNDVKKEWPLLMTADSLLGMQAMLRIVLLLSASFRRPDARSSPFDGEPAAFFLLAALFRVILFVVSPRDVYHLDGPLGGDMNVTLEVTAFLLLAPLGIRMLQKGIGRIASVTLVLMLLAVLANGNHFALADASQSHLDKLFSLVMLLETVAGVAFYVRSARSKGNKFRSNTFSGFAHVILPVQQALPAYFLLVAFAPPFQVEPSLVGKGRPFEMLQAGGLLQVVMYILTAVLYSMACIEEKCVSAIATLVPADQVPAADECVICLGSCDMCEDGEEQTDRWRRLRCGHHFHEHCIFEWFNKSQQCPTCRRHICEKGTTKWAEDASRPMEAAAVIEEVSAHGTEMVSRMEL